MHCCTAARVGILDPAQLAAAMDDADASTRKAGYGLTMQQGGRALDALGVSEAVRAAATPTRLAAARCSAPAVSVHVDEMLTPPLYELAQPAQSTRSLPSTLKLRISRSCSVSVGPRPHAGGTLESMGVL